MCPLTGFPTFKSSEIPLNRTNTGHVTTPVYNNHSIGLKVILHSVMVREYPVGVGLLEHHGLLRRHGVLCDESAADMIVFIYSYIPQARHDEEPDHLLPSFDRF